MRLVINGREEKRVIAQAYWATWRRHFAWLPVRVGLNDYRWLEYVERRGWGGVLEANYGFFSVYRPYEIQHKPISRSADE